MKQRIYSLDVIRLYLSIVIAFFHCYLHLDPGAVMAVQIFFVIFGFFLAKKFYEPVPEGKTKPDAWAYTIAHIRSFYPHLLFSVTVYYLYRLARYVLVDGLMHHTTDWFYQAAKDLYLLIPEYSLMLSAYHKYMSANFAIWQLSAMLITGYFIYALLHRNEKLARTILLPAGMLMGASMLSQFDRWENVGPIYVTLVYSFVPMTVGYFCYLFSTTSAYTRLKSHKILFNLAAVLSIAAIVVFQEIENLHYLTISIVILSCWDPDSLLNKLLNHRCFRWSGRLSVAIYLDHMMIARIMLNPVEEFFAGRGVTLLPWQYALIYLVMVVGYSICTCFIVDKCVAVWKAKKAAA